MAQVTAHTEWTLCIIKIFEAIACLLCMLYHINSVFYKEEPMPHNVLFCSTFGGFFILSMSGIFVPISGQKTPPGGDLIFCITAFALFFSAAAVAMYYAEWDPHLEHMTDEQEEIHPFFVHCKYHAVLSLVTGTLFMMHGVISADRLYYAKKGYSIDDDEERTHEEVDLNPELTLQLHIFLLDWIIHLWNTKCCQCIFRFFERCCSFCSEKMEQVPIPQVIHRRRKRKKRSSSV